MSSVLTIGSVARALGLSGSGISALKPAFLAGETSGRGLLSLCTRASVASVASVAGGGVLVGVGMSLVPLGVLVPLAPVWAYGRGPKPFSLNTIEV